MSTPFNRRNLDGNRHRVRVPRHDQPAAPGDPGRSFLIEDHVPDDARWFLGALVVEPRYCPDIVAALIADGLAVTIGDHRVTVVP